MVPLVVEALRGGLSLESLREKYKIKVSRHSSYNNLVGLKYDQIESDMSLPLVQQCRGLILDEGDNWSVVAWPFDKFFNYGEGAAATINWETAAVQEKLDGSLCIMYHYKGNWCVGTSGTPDASGVVNGNPFTFEDLFWRVWDDKKYQLPAGSDHLTFMFELMTPFNKVVVQHKGNDLKLIGVRYRDTGDEADIRWIPWFEKVREYPLGTMERVKETFTTMNPLQQEGYVIVDHEYKRIKVKHPGYVALHHLRDGLGPKRVLEVVRSGESSEFLVYFPEWKGVFDKIKGAYSSLVDEVEGIYGLYKDIGGQKEFALKVKDLPYSGILFGLRSGKRESVTQALQDMSIDRVMGLLDLDGL